MIFEYDPVVDKVKIYNRKDGTQFGWLSDLYRNKD